jgi:hypothetical protein
MIVSFIVLVIIFASYKFYLSTVDSKYAATFWCAFQNYDIEEVDNYLSKDTVIICNGKQGLYQDLRENLAEAFEDRKFIFYDSYGYGNDTFLNGIQQVKIFLYGQLNERKIDECVINMTLRQVGLFKFKIETIECNETIFDYLFY